MPFHRTKRNISTLRQSSEETRLKAASRLIIIVSIIVVAIWLFILLPLQLLANNFFADRNQTDESGSPANEGTGPEVNLFTPDN